MRFTILLPLVVRRVLFRTSDPEFGFTKSFKAWWGKISATCFQQATKEASADSSHSQGEKRPLPSTQDVGEDMNSSGYNVEIPPADDIILARPRKISRNPMSPGSSRIVEQPNPTHSAVSSSAIPEFRNPIFETEVGGQTATSEAEVETEVIGVNPSTNPDVVMAEPQQVTQPSGSREVDRGVIDDPSHIPDHQSRDHPDQSSDPRDPTDHSTDVQILQTTSANQTANVNGVLPAILVTLSDEPVSRIPQPSSDVSTPILTDQQHEVREPIMPDLSSSLLDHWDASATTAEASTRHATSSTVAVMLPDPAAEALLQSYRDRDCISLADQDERDKVKAAIESLVNSSFFPDQTTIRMIMHLFGEVARLIPCHPSLREELRIRQLQERNAAILIEVSEDIRSYGPLEAQLLQDSIIVKSFEARKLPIISALSVGESSCERFKTTLHSLFPDV
ncbi:hypothetical protein L3X38_033134 [Prunus dulcis]|uniref:Uncharacterized protein n=1 Tax=Prunus dulcis TaxID=3755 RepID=A0AAD4VHH8_PRUDU|nr:hypothetical protein L3X38_033134 [Prunus dulcis]